MLVDGDGTIDGQKTDEHSLEPEQAATPKSGPMVETEHVLDDDDGQPVRPKRTRKPPDYLRDLLSTVHSGWLNDRGEIPFYRRPDTDGSRTTIDTRTS